jgi:hypothetical protein
LQIPHIDGANKTADADLDPARYLEKMSGAGKPDVLRWSILAVAGPLLRLSIHTGPAATEYVRARDSLRASCARLGCDRFCSSFGHAI